MPPQRSSAETGHRPISCNQERELTRFAAVVKYSREPDQRDATEPFCHYMCKKLKVHSETGNPLTWCWPCERQWLCSAPFWWRNRRQTWQCGATSLWWWSSNTQSRLIHSEEKYKNLQSFGKKKLKYKLHYYGLCKIQKNTELLQKTNFNIMSFAFAFLALQAKPTFLWVVFFPSLVI